MNVPRTPRSLGLPYDEWRPGQRYAVREATDEDLRVALQLPTGAGKSLVATAVARLTGRTAILTGTLGLQDQYGRIFSDLVDIRGLSNYPCLAARDEHRRYFVRIDPRRVMCDDGYCHVEVPCTLKNAGCTYFDKYREAKAANALVTSYAYWFAVRRWGQGLGAFNTVVCDEAHSLLEQLTSAFAIELPRREVSGRTPRSCLQWSQWATARVSDLEDVDTNKRDITFKKRIERLRSLERIDDDWAFEESKYGWRFEPITPARYLKLLAPDNVRVVCLSATMTEAMLNVVGFKIDRFIEQGSTFDVSRRPVYLLDSVRVDYRTMQDRANVETWLERITKVVKTRNDRKGLVHTVSYVRMQQVADAIRSVVPGVRVFSPRNSFELRRMMPLYLAEERPSVLVSPSITTGLDFPGRAAEYQIICKTPFPDTRGAITRARCKRIKGYRDMTAMATLQQATGRVMRYPEDRGETFIIDNHFGDWAYRKMQCYLTDWFDEAVEYTRLIPPAPERVAA